MSYVRTKEKVISLEKYEIINENDVDIVIRKHNERFKNKTHTKVWNNGNNVVVAQADTIEKLCDEFIVETYDSVSDIFCGRWLYATLKDAKQSCDAIHKCYYKILGAIWYDDGLKYVAKLNDEGELKLI